jgi:hypothetical protein
LVTSRIRYFRATLVTVGLLAAAACTPSREKPTAEASANFDVEDVEPVLARVAGLVDSGFTASDAKLVASTIAKQPVGSEREYRYPVRAAGGATELRIVAVMDDVDAPDLSFVAHPELARAIQAAIAQYMNEVGK